MPQYTYTAVQSDGTRKEGTIEAFSLQAAHDALKQMHLIAEEIHESLPSEQPLTPERAETLLSFTVPAAVGETPAEIPPKLVTESPQVPSPKSSPAPSYFPLLDTLRLYAGWLLAWYCLVYALGSYQHVRPLPFRIPFVEGLFLSPLVFSFSLAAYLFLLLTGIWKGLGRGIIKGFLALVLGIAAFLLYRMNVL